MSIGTDPKPLSPEEELRIRKAGPEGAEHILWDGLVEVAPGKEIYVMEWGNRNAPVKYIQCHGGPGTGFGPSHVALFNPEVHHVVFHDQRGCGESVPAAATLDIEGVRDAAHTDNLVADVAFLQEKFFNGKKIRPTGTSWGSTLPLLYAERHPDKVERLPIGSIFLATPEEINEMFEQQREEGFPYEVEHAHFIYDVAGGDQALIEKLTAMTGREIVEYLGARALDSDPAVAAKHALAFESYEYVLCARDGQEEYADAYEVLKGEEAENKNIVSHGRIEMMSHLNGAFLEPNEILANIHKISHIPVDIVQGERDRCTPTKWALVLKQAIEEAGGTCTFQEVASGHLRFDKEMQAALRKILLIGTKYETP